MSDRNDFKPDSIAALAAVARLLAIAKTNSGQARRVADFLLAWHNAEENGGWNPVDLWQLDTGIAQDILLVTAFIAVEHKHPDDLGFAPRNRRGLESLEREPDCRSRPIGQLNWLWKGVLMGVHGQHGAIRFQHYGLPESEKIERWTS